jgi:hypothetical protein
MTVLTGADAKKFRNQVRYGRPKRAAVEAAHRGVAMAKELAETGRVQIRLSDGIRD